MLQALIFLGLGFVFGLRHALDADHIAAVSIFSIHSKSGGLVKGFVWGLGHTITLIGAAAVFIVFNISMPPQWHIVIELIIGYFLIFLGMRTMLSVPRGNVQLHRHPPFGLHGHMPTFLTGMVHGLAGSGLLIILLLSKMDSFMQSVLYILAFSSGLVVAMSLFSCGIKLLAHQYPRQMTLCAGIFSLVTGAVALVAAALP